MWKTSEAANLVFQWIFVLNSVKHKFFHVSIADIIEKHLYWNVFLNKPSYSPTFIQKEAPALAFFWQLSEIFNNDVLST